MRWRKTMSGWRIFELLALASFLLAFLVRNYFSITSIAVSCPPLIATKGATVTKANLSLSAENKNPIKDTVLSLEEKTENSLPRVSANPNSDGQSEEDRQPIIWVEGLQRSGTTLMRVLLDTDPKINCGPEPMFFWSFFNYIHHVMRGVY